MSSPDPDRRPRRGPRFLLPARAWLIIAAAFTAGLLLSGLLWFGQRGERTAAPAAVTTPAEAADTTASGLPTPQPADPADPGGASGMEEPDPDAQPQWVEQAPEPEPSRDGPGFVENEASATAAAATRAPVAVETPAPRYPSSALRRGDSGEVVLQVRVGADGSAQAVEVVRGSNSRALDRAAVAAVRRWRFQPALRDGQPVPGMVQVPIVFNPAR
ncbi:energy transducer TonB [Luteimonas suaedae]|uniref:energy transducer TonB n=1 Tax=Luteimonas suaedae TaxID=2605430 RepID=UPI0011EE5D22|nr:energy transducer TonB [Luteimonas suaedae]